jgi:hypothetical protein
MKKLMVLTLLLFCAAPLFVFGESADALYLEITLTTGERSRDSNSTTTEITITGRTLTYKETYGGRSGGRAPRQKALKLNAEDQRKIIKLINDRNLLRTDSIERAQDASGIYRYFELSIGSTINKSKGSISISGSRKATDLKEEKLYKDAVALVEEIYGIIHRTDGKIVYEPLIH